MTITGKPSERLFLHVRHGGKWFSIFHKRASTRFDDYLHSLSQSETAPKSRTYGQKYQPTKNHDSRRTDVGCTSGGLSRRNRINLLSSFLVLPEKSEKTQQVVNYVKRTGHLDEPLTINRETNMLTDGYRRYIVDQQVELDKVPVVYEKETAPVKS